MVMKSFAPKRGDLDFMDRKHKEAIPTLFRLQDQLAVKIDMSGLNLEEFIESLPK